MSLLAILRLSIIRLRDINLKRTFLFVIIAHLTAWRLTWSTVFKLRERIYIFNMRRIKTFTPKTLFDVMRAKKYQGLIIS